MYKESQDQYHGLLEETARDAFALIFHGFRFEVTGQENLSLLRNGQAAIIAFFPHCGHLDSAAVRKAVPKELRHTLMFPAADYWHKPGGTGVFKSILSSLVVPNFPISRGEENLSDIIESLNRAEMMLNLGYTLVVSPEGTRSSLPLQDRKLHTGVAELILRTGKPVIPIRLRGLEEAMPRGTIIPHFLEGNSRKKVSIGIGNPLYFDIENLPNVRSWARKEILMKLKETFIGM